MDLLMLITRSQVIITHRCGPVSDWSYAAVVKNMIFLQLYQIEQNHVFIQRTVELQDFTDLPPLRAVHPSMQHTLTGSIFNL
ncbi:hypothetical protein KFU94_48905 [Chloroflexi bacterium TSY]|nr:hypothetical protein [Chloroflexi bacterium TSY]